MTNRLTRSSSDSMIAGVCGGIAHYAGIDPTIVRVAFVAATVMGFSGLFAYIILAIVMPKDQ
ncbi:hypothetical protein CPHO_03065 [Corynebacterium phocae]|uniref:Phage shock protein PspC N-terminal domain-containing protein n=1 Tax=Corynebacterium phocae TaxID=161895 RepID=A0A1L7D251_9CORY|nr:PspC domain-containing protein [Corynebacterium phocae]APT92041.1 hypothetical protein CPHO_03065 [Corynebacterium phocae]KAA8726423.1 PspC domain-containing protein [Corynebacterium phocae]